MIQASTPREPGSSPAARILTKALDILDERGKEYEQAQGERSMAKTVEIFFAVTRIRLTEYEGWKFMQCLKLARQAVETPKLDSFIDSINYEALAAECALRPSSKEPV
jgi:hypothetical protein